MALDVTLPNDWEYPVVVAKFRTRLEADKWPENIGVVRESPRIFILEAEDLVDFLLRRDGTSIDWPKNMLPVSSLARVYFVII